MKKKLKDTKQNISRKPRKSNKKRFEVEEAR
jgi:hypothetical protein